jgi:hypothetical protein
LTCSAGIFHGVRDAICFTNRNNSGEKNQNIYTKNKKAKSGKFPASNPHPLTLNAQVDAVRYIIWKSYLKLNLVGNFFQLKMLVVKNEAV